MFKFITLTIIFLASILHADIIVLRDGLEYEVEILNVNNNCVTINRNGKEVKINSNLIKFAVWRNDTTYYVPKEEIEKEKNENSLERTINDKNRESLCDSCKFIFNCSGCYNKGIYKNFKEFLSNSPSYKKYFYIEEEELTPDYSTYKLVHYNGKKFTRYKDDYWGYCLDSQIFVKYFNRYYKVNVNKFYSFFFIKLPPIPNSKNHLLKSRHLRNTKEYHNEKKKISHWLRTYDESLDTYIINMQTEKILKLTDINLIKIITSDNKLYKEYKIDKDRNKNLLSYLLRYLDNNNEKVSK